MIPWVGPTPAEAGKVQSSRPGLFSSSDSHHIFLYHVAYKLWHVRWYCKTDLVQSVVGRLSKHTKFLRNVFNIFFLGD